MRVVIVSILLFLVGCSDQKIIELTKKRANRFEEISKTYYALTNSATIVIIDNSNRNFYSFIIEIMPKDVNSKLFIKSCKINNQEATITLQDSSYSNWQSRYEVSAFKTKNSKNKIECILSNKEVLSKSIR